MGVLDVSFQELKKFDKKKLDDVELELRKEILKVRMVVFENHSAKNKRALRKRLAQVLTLRNGK